MNVKCDFIVLIFLNLHFPDYLRDQGSFKMYRSVKRFLCELTVHIFGYFLLGWLSFFLNKNYLHIFITKILFVYSDCNCLLVSGSISHSKK